MAGLYVLKQEPTFRAIQFTGNIDEIEEFLLGTDRKVYRNSEGNLVIDEMPLNNYDYVIETINDIDVMSEVYFTERYKRIY